MEIPQKDFNLWKKQALEKADKSSANQIDKPIKKLCDIINKSENYFTLSSCSGRISIQKQAYKKEELIWIFTSHSQIQYKEILPYLEDNKKELWFLQEGAILHICCRSIEYAQALINKAKSAGWNQCGIISSKRKIVVEIIVDTFLKLPITKDEKILLSEQYLLLLIDKANKNLEISHNAITKLEEAF